MKLNQGTARQFGRALLAAALGVFATAQAMGEVHHVHFFPTTAEADVRQGFLRVINHSDVPGEVSIAAIDDSGTGKDAVWLSLDANQTVHFNSGDLENGNEGKGLSGGVGAGEGAWRLSLRSDLNLGVLSYMRTRDGLVTTMHEVLPLAKGDGSLQYAAIFNPGSNFNQVSILRLINDADQAASVTVTGVDDRGASGEAVRLSLPAGAAAMLSARDLELGEGAHIEGGALGDGAGKWQLFVESDRPLTAMSLLESPTGHIANLSTIPEALEGRWIVPLFPASADAGGRQGFLRVINHSDGEATVSIQAFNNSGLEHEPLSLTIGANATQHFNSDDLELGNEAKGLSGSTGMGDGDWVLALSSEQDISVLAYLRTPGGFLTSAHDLVAGRYAGTHHRIAFFNPGSNYNQVSTLKVINLGEEDAGVVVSGVDDAGSSPGGEVAFVVPAGASRAIKASELELGERAFAEAERGFENEPLQGALGDGAGKWQLTVDSSAPVLVMSVLASPTGHLTNLSSTP